MGNDTGSVGYKRGRSGSSASTVITGRPNYRAYPPPVMGDIPIPMPCRPSPSPSPQQIALSNELQITTPKGVGGGLRETRSTFFGTSEMMNIGRTASPYRRAMAEADQHAARAAGNDPQSPFARSGAPWPIVGQAPERLASGARERAYSESVYSRTTSGQTPPDAWGLDARVVADDDVKPGRHGSVRLIERATYRFPPPEPRGPSVKQRLTSTSAVSASSSEWRGWMSKQVAGFGGEGEKEVRHAVPKMGGGYEYGHGRGHVREEAQIGGDGEEREVGTGKVRGVVQPLGVLQQQQQQRGNTMMPKPILKKQNSVMSLELSPFPTVPVLNRMSMMERPPPSPSPNSRGAPSRCSIRSVNTVLAERNVSANANANVNVNVNVNGARRAGEEGEAVVRKQLSVGLRGVDGADRLVKWGGMGVGMPSPVFEGRVKGMENWSPNRDEGMGMGMGKAEEKRKMGSQRMVDLFLSSRRRRVAGSEDSGAFL